MHILIFLDTTTTTSTHLVSPTTPALFAIMSHLIPPQEEKKDTRSQALPVDHSWPEQEQSGQTFKEHTQAPLVPPQEEKADIAGSHDQQSRLDQGVYPTSSRPRSTPQLLTQPPAALGRVQDQMSQHRVERDGQASDDPAAAKQQRDSVLSGAAGVTGEDLGVAENQRIV